MTTTDQALVRRLVGQQLRALRQSAHLTQLNLAQLLDRSQSWIGGVEHGTREPSLSEYFAYAGVFKQDPVLLFSEIAAAIARSAGRDIHREQMG